MLRKTTVIVSTTCNPLSPQGRFLATHSEGTGVIGFQSNLWRETVVIEAAPQLLVPPTRTVAVNLSFVTRSDALRVALGMGEPFICFTTALMSRRSSLSPPSCPPFGNFSHRKCAAGQSIAHDTVLTFSRNTRIQAVTCNARVHASNRSTGDAFVQALPPSFATNSTSSNSGDAPTLHMMRDILVDGEDSWICYRRGSDTLPGCGSANDAPRCSPGSTLYADPIPLSGEDLIFFAVTCAPDKVPSEIEGTGSLNASSLIIFPPETDGKSAQENCRGANCGGINQNPAGSSLWWLWLLIALLFFCCILGALLFFFCFRGKKAAKGRGMPFIAGPSSAAGAGMAAGMGASYSPRTKISILSRLAQGSDNHATAIKKRIKKGGNAVELAALAAMDRRIHDPEGFDFRTIELPNRPSFRVQTPRSNDIADSTSIEL